MTRLALEFLEIVCVLMRTSFVCTNIAVFFFLKQCVYSMLYSIVSGEHALEIDFLMAYKKNCTGNGTPFYTLMINKIQF